MTGGSAGAAPCRLLLHDLQSPINIGSILRVAETFAVPVEIWDPRGRFDDATAINTISDFSCGAYARGVYRHLLEAPTPGRVGGRLVATVLAVDAVLLPEFTFHPTDLVAIGNEYDGLPKSLIAAADVRLYIPMPPTKTPKPLSHRPTDPTRANFMVSDESPVLSAAMAAGIVCYSASTARAR